MTIEEVKEKTVPILKRHGVAYGAFSEAWRGAKTNPRAT
jgi:hypothetical protein